MQTDEEIGKVAAAVPVIICILFFLLTECLRDHMHFTSAVKINIAN